MELNKLISIKTTKKAKRLGRGLSSGKGETSGRGTKGQKSRSGHNIPRSFEGGQTPLIQRLAKARGFNSIHAKPEIVHIVDIEKNFNDGDTVNFKSLLEKKLVHSVKDGVKVVGPGKLTKSLRFLEVKLTKSLFEAASNNKPAAKPAKAVEAEVKEAPVKKVTEKKPVAKKSAKKAENKDICD